MLYKKEKNDLAKMITEISDLIKIEFSDFQSFESVLDWPVAGIRTIGNGIISIKVFQGKDHMRFYVQIPPHEEFEIHWHDCSEVCQVIGGTMKDKTTGKIFKAGETAVFSQGHKHKPLNPDKRETCFLIVDFYR